MASESGVELRWSVGWSYIGVWVDVGPSTKYGVELRLSVISAWGWS